MERPRGEDFINLHCFECGNTFDCPQNLELHCERLLHNKNGTSEFVMFTPNFGQNKYFGCSPIKMLYHIQKEMNNSLIKMEKTIKEIKND